MNDNDDNDRLVILAKRTGRALGLIVALYLAYSIGQQLRFW